MSYQISEIYTDVEANGKRYEELKAYCKEHKYTLKNFARSPGRVNIISEHTDYHGY